VAAAVQRGWIVPSPHATRDFLRKAVLPGQHA